MGKVSVEGRWVRREDIGKDMIAEASRRKETEEGTREVDGEEKEEDEKR